MRETHRYRWRLRDWLRRTCTCGRRGYCPYAAAEAAWDEARDAVDNPDGPVPW